MARDFKVHPTVNGDTLLASETARNVVQITQAQYEAITPDPNTIYLIEGPASASEAVVRVNHGTDANAPRPNAGCVIWHGTVEPNNWTDADFWHDVS